MYLISQDHPVPVEESIESEKRWTGSSDTTPLARFLFFPGHDFGTLGLK